MTGTAGAGTAPGYPRPRVPGWVTDTAAATAILVVTVLPVPGAPVDVPDGLTLVLVALAAGVLPLRRRWPKAVLGTCLVLYGGASLHGVLCAGLALAVAIATFGLMSRLDRRPGLIISVAAVALTAGLSLMAGPVSASDPRVVQFALAVALATAAGDATRLHRAYIIAVTERAERAEQTREAEAKRRVSEERLKIARDLHDTVAHQIAVINLHAGVATTTVDNRPDKAKESLATIRSAARTVLGEIGDLLDLLRAGDDARASTTPQPGLDRLTDLIGQFNHAGLDVTLRVEGDLTGMTGAADLVAYRVVQEALTNAHKHGAHHRAHVLVTVAGGEVTIVVTNPVGAAADPVNSASPAAAGSRLGLIGLRERVGSVRGSVDIGPCPGGWKVTARLPATSQAPS